MNETGIGREDPFYTNDHEWIDFRGAVAYTGVCAFKLKGIKKVERIDFMNEQGFKKQGELIAVIVYDDYKIPVHMPVDGKIKRFNKMSLTLYSNLLLQEPEGRGWIALIVPFQADDRTGLIPSKQYRTCFIRPNIHNPVRTDFVKRILENKGRE
jgi:glycine cleavage system H protein